MTAGTQNKNQNKDQNMTTLVESVIQFSNESMLLCTRESEKAVGVVGQILDIIVQDAARVSKMSADALDALKNLSNQFQEVQQASAKALANEVSPSAAAPANPQRISKLIDALKKISHEHADIYTFIGPIIENLQFQDRIRQQMENLGKMMPIWLELRTAEKLSAENYEATLLELGTRMLDITTTNEERPVIRANIPNLPEQANVAADDGFFF